MPNTLVYNYGSNSTAQLRGRLDSPELSSWAAWVDGYVRIFSGCAPSWGNGGVASLAKKQGGRTYGSVVELTPEQKRKLDSYEGARYDEITLTAHVNKSRQWVQRQVVAYIQRDSTFQCEPTEQYLCAVHVMLREHWQDCSAIAVRQRKPDGTVVTRSTWHYPGIQALGLKAFLVELNARRADPDHPWKLPYDLDKIERELSSIGVTNVAKLTLALAPGTDRPTLNEGLATKGHRKFAASTLELMRSLVSPSN